MVLSPTDHNTHALPPYLLDAWRLRQRDEAENRRQVDDWTVTSLAKAFLRSQLESYEATTRKDSDTPTPSLSTLAVGSLLDALDTSSNPNDDARTIAEQLTFPTLKRLLKDPKLSYQTFRILYDLPPSKAVKAVPRALDIDEVILRNERYIRSRGTANQDGKYLVHLDKLPNLIPQAVYIQDGNVLSFVRTEIPKGGLEVLDYLRAKEMQIQATDTSFLQTFTRITRGILNGLDWNNVFMAGGIVLTTLLHIAPSSDDDRRIKDPDIDLYIYGLGPEDANSKVQHIYDIWCRNLPSDALRQLVVKNAKTINLLTAYPNRRVQIVLKLLPSPTDILLNFDLDACAIGFDGSHILMLPRCARALETGYSVFTMDLVWGHHLGDRRATQDARVFKYADRGFGIRILPSYARSIGDGEMALKTRNPVKDPDSEEEIEGSQTHDWEPRPRYPNGKEPGLKTLKRIGYLGCDFLHRCYFGATPLAISEEQYRQQIDPSYVMNENSHAEWQVEYDERKEVIEKIRRANDLCRSRREALEGPFIRLADMDGDVTYRNHPNGRRGLGSLETFMRHCEAWRLSARREATLDPYGFASTVYDAETYDDLPTYHWGPAFAIQDFEKDIETTNGDYWNNVKAAICRKLNIPVVFAGFGGYATRRLRRQVHGPDLDSVMQKQITVPVILPSDLEQYIIHTLPEQYPDLPSHFIETPCLIPLHDPATHNSDSSPFPSLRDTGNESGNLRYWVITNESMWAGQHRVMDEIAELVWTLFHWLMQHSLGNGPNSGIDTSNTACVYHVARAFRRRIVLPEISEQEELAPGLPSKREARLFRPWALLSPMPPQRHFIGYASAEQEHFFDKLVRYPFEDELFWKGDEEELGEEGKDG